MPAPKYSPHHVALGAAIRELREAEEISQEQLAFDAGLHRNYLGRVERGELNLSFDRLVRLAAALEMSLSKLVEAYEAELDH